MLHAPEVGGAWSRPAGFGTARLDGSGGLRTDNNPVTGFSDYTNAAIAPAADYTIDYEIHRYDATGTDLSILHSYTDTNNNAEARYSSAGAFWVVNATFAGVPASSALLPDVIPNGTTRVAHLVRTGNNYKLTVDGVGFVGVNAIGALPIGNPGLRWSGGPIANATGTHIDLIEAHL